MNTTFKQPAIDRKVVYVRNESIQNLVLAATEITIASYWCDTSFDPKMTNALETHIQRNLLQERDPYQAYCKYCCQVLLISLEVTNNSGPNAISMPAHWFTNNNSQALVRLLKWVTDLYAASVTNQQATPGMRALAEAVLDMKEVSNKEVSLRYWLEWFSYHDQLKEYRLFLNCCELSGYAFAKKFKLKHDEK